MKAELCAFALGMVVALGPVAAAPPPPYQVLVFSRTAGFRHDSIPAGIAALRTLGQENGFAVETTEDAAAFSPGNLGRYAVVVFLCTTGDVLDREQQAAFEGFIHAGGGFVGVHSASDTEYDWPWYGGLVGAYFRSHAPIQPATVLVADRVHPSTASLPRRWSRTDEWYQFQTNPRSDAHVLMTVDERTYSAGAATMGFDHPIAWCHAYGGGRAWYTAGGHTAASYDEPLFRQHLLGGIHYAAGVESAEDGASLDKSFQKVVLDHATWDPVELALPEDGRVLWVERHGRLKIWKPDTGATVIAGQVRVFDGLEDGLMGLALDPGFTTNHWLYVFKSSPDQPQQHISRFTLVGDTLDLSSEKILLTIPAQRQQCCHSGGHLRFGPGGNLFIGVGDNTNPFESWGFAPLDERPGRSPWDAQKSASNTDDLRGKILRIHPEPDGSYTIPPGNLFPPGTPRARPEIYTMGNRNPFRLSVDAATGWLYWGEVGPDAREPNPDHGPMGYDEWNQARSAGNYGWPYAIANNQPYLRFDFAANRPGPPYDPAAPANDSPNNTGLRELPPARPAWIWYPYSPSADFPELTATGIFGRTAMAGPVYHYRADLASPHRLPPYYDGTLFLYEWSRGFIKEVKLDDQGDLLKINPFLASFQFLRPIDMDIGPDGRLYVIEWGRNFGGGNPDAKVVRIDYVAHDQPVVHLQSAPAASGPFSDEPGAAIDLPTRTITVPLLSTVRFYRLRGDLLTRIVSVRRLESALVLEFN